MEFGQLHHVEYYVDNLEKSNEFWTWFLAEFNYKKYQEFSGGVSWAHPNGTYLVFVQVEKKHLKANNNRHGNGLNHIAFNGRDLDHLQEIEKKLKEKYIKILKFDDIHICFEDPNGFAVEIFLPEKIS